ncbi:MAG TPA: hypothetical protein DC057_00120 [Spirochaetia bacterium]|nr:hypothetical protein [Spirochaetia bacterium]
MTNKTMCVLMEWNGGDTLIVRVEDWKDFVTEIDCLLIDGEAGDIFSIILIEKDEEELDNLPEFEGW